MQDLLISYMQSSHAKVCNTETIDRLAIQMLCVLALIHCDNTGVLHYDLDLDKYLKSVLKFRSGACSNDKSY